MNITTQSAGSRKNPTSLMIVAAAHVVLAVVMLRNSTVSMTHPPMPVEVSVVAAEPLPPPPHEPELMQVTAVTPPVFVPQVEVDVAVPEPATVATTHALPTQAEMPPGPATAAVAQEGVVAVAEPVRVTAVVEASACTKPEYPAAAQRNGNTGVVTLALLVGTDGRVADARIERSSGFRDLDKAARTGLALCRFKPGTIDGVPYQSWTKMQYVWSLD